VVAAAAVIGATFQMVDTDVWQHLAVGRAIWTGHRIPMTNQWTWPSFGAPYVLPSWGFRALLWPFYALAGIDGLALWRWLTTLAVFAIAWRTARTMGARGFASLVAIAWCVLVYRHRIYVRPETLVAILLAVTIWILETRRHGKDHSWWLVAVACAWANIHISYWMLFALTGAHLVEDLLVPPRRGPKLLWVMLVALAACFLNPFGWKALVEPFRYAFTWRNEVMTRTIGELQPVDWKFLARTGYVVLLPLWPVLIALRALGSRARRGAGWDLAELLTCVGFSAIGLANQRFVSVWAVVAAPYLARGVASLAASIRWPRALRPAWARAAIATLVIVLGSLPEWRRSDMPIGTALLPSSYPAGACDFMEKQDIRGRGFNHFELGGYLLWRFWPQKDRLPFVDIHFELTEDPVIRRLAGLALTQPDAWRQLDQREHFEWALLRRLHSLGDVSLDILEADSTWRLVFLDDAAALYLKRAGARAALADSLGYRLVRAGRAGMADMGRAFAADSNSRRVLRAEFQRMAASSSANSGAHSLLSQLDLLEGHWEDAARHLREAYRVDPLVPRYHERLGLLELKLGHLAVAVDELERASRSDRTASAWTLLAQARAASGDRAGAERAAREALKLDPGADVGNLGGGGAR
jgi:hypothetical protein